MDVSKTIAELRKNAVAAGMMLAAVTLGTIVAHVLLGWC